MKSKKTFDVIALVIAFVGIWAIFETQTSKYYELERRIGAISLQKMEEIKEEKGHDSNVLIVSSECPYCLHFQDNLYIFLKKLGSDYIFKCVPCQSYRQGQYSVFTVLEGVGVGCSHLGNWRSQYL